MKEKNTVGMKLLIFICLLIVVLIGIVLFEFGNRNRTNKSDDVAESKSKLASESKNETSEISESDNENKTDDEPSSDLDSKFDKIQIVYDYGSLLDFSGTYEDEDEDNVIKIDLKGKQLAELQSLLSNYDIESDKYKIEDTGHSHGTIFYSNIVIMPAEYKLIFNDGSEMMTDERDYEIQYKKGKNYYSITDAEDVSQKVIEIVDEKLHEEPVKIDTDKISIEGLISGNTLNITDKETISKILYEFRYNKDNIIDEELYESLIDQQKDDYDEDRENPRELEYNIDFNNGTIIKIELRNGNVGCISNKNNKFIEGIKINSKFVFMIHNIFTEYYREENKLFEAEEIIIQHEDIESKLSEDEKTEFLNKLLMTEVDGDKMDEERDLTASDYVLIINNNRLILSEDSLYILYADGKTSYIYSMELKDYIKTLVD